MQKILNTRISQRHDTEERWNANSSSIPIAGEIIIYDPDATTSFARIKIGDGVTSVGELPFIEESKLSTGVGLKVENDNTNNTRKISIDEDVTFIFVCGTAADDIELISYETNDAGGQTAYVL